MRKIIKSSKAPAPIGPYNQAILAGNTLYISGQIALNHESGKLEIDSLEQETKRVMHNLQAVLQEAEMELEHIVKCSIFISNMDDFAKINELYGSYFEEANAPARETVEVARLPKNVNVEISAIAVK